jgi:hypothetical protein
MSEILILKKLLEDSINDVYAEERFILKFEMQDINGLEQAFGFRLGVHLSERIKFTDYKTMDLDAEYNKNLGLSKMLEEFENGIRPDLLLHQRGNHKHNFLAIELKGYWNKVINKDERKLIGLTSSAGDYNYLLGALILIGKTSAKINYYVDGKILRDE